ncbi:MAG: 2'-5' RNA ligase [Candidatus Fraserbacteria bacterium RBG_16_55_9]|uniref:RNA 2',3'-cyclic phosphodiesterase n=1 Tax=Fraserbacteria sp. (strain RBG_16_55_9) TaxID=1817864 RepID=A0A1F5V2N2_FRAXR|nr:MAG: 2'-5' RNA ligase [Candidatus Fraserbacteria bacterium RBG_16_55_9]
MRAFFCLELESPLQHEIDKITQVLRRARTKVSWVKPENLHVTVKFLGEIPAALVPKLEAAGRDALRESGIQKPVEWELDRVGAFPSLERPRVIWVGCSKEPEALGCLAVNLEVNLDSLGFAPERGHFVTHITLGRVKEEGPGVQDLAQALHSMKPFSHRARASAMTLMESQLTPQGSTYKPVFRLSFTP